MADQPGDMERINVNEIDTVCCECYRVTPNRWDITCPICHGTVIHVQAGGGRQAATDLKKLGKSHLAI